MGDEFDFTKKDLKNYPHFDAPISLRKVEQLVTDPNRVAKNTFFPFFLYHEEWQPYRSADVVRPERKSRPIRYGARRDAYIFMHYRRKLSKRYEMRIQNMGISECPIAYRKLRKPGGLSGKSNIDFAKDAFDEIERIGDCVAIALDIESYFESLDHKRIKDIWEDLLGVNELPNDHFAVFKNITRYRFVDQRDVYQHLGYLKQINRNGKIIEEFTKPYHDMPKQLCDMQEFREKICGNNPQYPSLVRKNTKGFGIPQGAPISDLIANFYLMDFDKEMHDYAVKQGGRYTRYSDDILLIIPGGEDVARRGIKFAADKIRGYGSQLKIKEKKTCVIQFQREGEALRFTHIKQHADEKGKSGLEYLGFRFDGRKIYVRDSTISRFYSKVAQAARQDAAKHVSNNPHLDAAELIKCFDYSLFNQRFGKVKRSNLTSNYRSWTFHTYIKRAGNTFGAKGNHILRQERNFKKFMHRRIEEAIVRCVNRAR